MLSSTMAAALVQPSSQLLLRQRNRMAVQPFQAAAGLRCERLAAVPPPCRAAVPPPLHAHLRAKQLP